MIDTKQNIRNQQFIALALREMQWLRTITESKISADDFYRSHRLSALGEPSYRAYIINKIKFIQKYTDEDNLANAWRSILLGTINNYHVPVQFTRYLIRSIKRRFTKINPRFNPIRAKDIATICNNKNDK